MPNVPNYCECPICLLLATVAVDFARLGLIDLARQIAAEVTVLPYNAGEGYESTWAVPTVDNAEVN